MGLLLGFGGGTLAPSRLVPLTPAAVTAGPRDSFTATDGTALETSNTAWTNHTTSGAGSATIDSGRVHNTNDATTHLYYHAYVPISPDYDVLCDVVMLSDNDASQAGPAARIDPTVNTCYALRYLASGNQWNLLKLVGGTATSLQSVSQVLTADQTYRARLSLRGSQIMVFVDGALIIDVADTGITAAGRAGMRFGAAATSSTGVHLDNWQVRR